MLMNDGIEMYLSKCVEKDCFLLYSNSMIINYNYYENCQEMQDISLWNRYSSMIKMLLQKKITLANKNANNKKGSE